MSELPFIDEHAVDTGATPELAWDAVARTVAQFGGAAGQALARVLGCADAGRSEAGDGLPLLTAGFHVASAARPEHILLAGSHRFSRYELRFDVDPDGTVRAQTRAAFPGVRGAAYRAAVIGSGGHRLAMKVMLAGIKARAARAARASARQEHGVVA